MRSFQLTGEMRLDERKLDTPRLSRGRRPAATHIDKVHWHLRIARQANVAQSEVETSRHLGDVGFDDAAESTGC